MKGTVLPLFEWTVLAVLAVLVGTVLPLFEWTVPPVLMFIIVPPFTHEPVMGELPPTVIHTGACLILGPLALLPEPLGPLPVPILPPELVLLLIAEFVHEPVMGELPPTDIHSTGSCLIFGPLALLPEPLGPLPVPILPPELVLLLVAALLHESVIGELPPTDIQLGS